ncbi:MAG TPA: hypothetical protein VGP07_08080 [Polyangia bacterium]|jgi:tetratricopeptide (TPR) repeat protein
MRGAALVGVVVACGGVAAAAWLVNRSHAGNEGRRLRAELAASLERGALADLSRAQALGRRLAISDPRDREAAAALAFTDAQLAVEYGVDSRREVEEMLGRVSATLAAGDPVSVMARAARALLLIRTGDRAEAIRVATSAAEAAPDAPAPLYALGRARALAGDPSAAGRAFEAAIVGTPTFFAARVAWAETRLDLGDARTADTTLAALIDMASLESAPAQKADLRTRLLLDEAEQALGTAAPAPPAGACVEGRWPPPAITAACFLARAERARRAGAREEARAGAEAAARVVPDEPRLLARIALALAQLGAIDHAAALVARAGHLSAPEMPALAWARAAVALGRGAVGKSPPGPRPADQETAVLSARIALSAGGPSAVGPALAMLADAPPTRDAELRILLGGDSAPGDPLRAYVDGLHAQLDGDLARAADRFAHALSGHGDACRAAGEYIAATRALKRRVEPTIFAPLRAENAGCVNLAGR